MQLNWETCNDSSSCLLIRKFKCVGSPYVDRVRRRCHILANLLNVHSMKDWKPISKVGKTDWQLLVITLFICCKKVEHANSKVDPVTLKKISLIYWFWERWYLNQRIGDTPSYIIWKKAHLIFRPSKFIWFRRVYVNMIRFQLCCIEWQLLTRKSKKTEKKN